MDGYTKLISKIKIENRKVVCRDSGCGKWELFSKNLFSLRGNGDNLETEWESDGLVIGSLNATERIHVILRIITTPCLFHCSFDILSPI